MSPLCLFLLRFFVARAAAVGACIGAIVQQWPHLRSGDITPETLALVPLAGIALLASRDLVDRFERAPSRLRWLPNPWASFTAAQTRGMRVFAGKTCMDRNAPEGLRDTVQSAYDDSKRLLQQWHGVDRLSYVITPRFSPTSTPEQLAALGALWREHPDCLMQTHLSEQTDEIAWVRDLFPQSRDYLDTYEAQGLLRAGGLDAETFERRDPSLVMDGLQNLDVADGRSQHG